LTPHIGRVAAWPLAYPFRVWGFGEGIALRGLLETHEPLYEGFVRGLFRSWVGRGGPQGFEDHVAPGYELLMLHERTGEAALLDAACRLAELHSSFPACEGARLHRTDQPGWKRQIWVDCMHVDGPFLARLGRITGRAELLDEAADQVLSYARLLQNESGLFRHGWEASSGPNGQLWARGNGWALTGMLDTLAELPANHAARPEIEERLANLLAVLEQRQTPRGLWHTVIDDETTYEETTLAAMLAYILRSAGDRQYERMRSAAEAAVLQHVSESGVLLLTSEATPVSERNVYATRRFGAFPWGQGPLLLLMCQPARSNGL
jgi:unsaturated rhamnogalacturonyl hydrolase